jgi:drug/metabolite transporter (DMT)-like permease
VQPSRTVLLGALAGAVTAVSSAAVVILLAAPVSALAIAAGRVGVTGVGLMAIGGRHTGRALRAMRPRAIALRTGLAAVLLAVHFGAWVASLHATSLVRSVALVATQPLFAGLFARALGDRVSPRLYLGGAIAIGGTLVMLGASGLEGGLRTGDALALVAAAAAAAYLAVGRSVRADVPLPTYLSLVHLGAAVLLGLTLVATGGVVTHGPAGAMDWLAVLYLGLVPGLVGHGLLNWAVRHLAVHTVSMALLLEPLGATVLAAIVLSVPVGDAELLGGAVILLGVALGIPRVDGARPAG